MWGSGTHLIHGSWVNHSRQPKRHHDRFSRLAGLTSVTDRQTDRPTERRQDFRGKGSSPCQYIDTTRKAIDCATTLPVRVFIKLNPAKGLRSSPPACTASLIVEVQKPHDVDLDLGSGQGQGHTNIHSTCRTTSVPNHVTVSSRSTEICGHLNVVKYRHSVKYEL